MPNEMENWRGQLGFLIIVFVIMIGGFALLMGDNNKKVDFEVIAYVNHQPISKQVYVSILSEMEALKQEALTDEEKNQLVDLIIDEELMIQEVLRQNILAQNPELRRQLSNLYMLERQQAWLQEDVAEADLKAFFEENKSAFAPSAQIYVKRIFVRGAQENVTLKLNQIRNAFQQGQSFEAVAIAFGDDLPPAIPAKLLTLEELKKYMGPALVERIQNLPTGTLTDAVQAGSGWHFIYIVDRLTGTPPAFEEVRNKVQDLYRNASFEAYLEEQILKLREQARVKKIN
ncbi:MAG: peptidylprolyl isomerase [Parvibaculales bacterium]